FVCPALLLFIRASYTGNLPARGKSQNQYSMTGHCGLVSGRITQASGASDSFEMDSGAGCGVFNTLDGSGMAVFQAVEAFRLFTGVTPDAERMLRRFVAMEATYS